MNCVIDLMAPDAGSVEIVERKGLGHPDTVADELAESFGRALASAYAERFGRVLPYNVDKALIVGGASRPGFGGGEVVAPIEIILAGRATTEAAGVTIPVDDIARSSAKEWIRNHLRFVDPDRHVRIVTRTRSTSRELVELFLRGDDREGRLSNDTSVGVGFAPPTALEQVVLAVEKKLNSPETKREHPEIGEDVKVLGFRNGELIDLTVSIAFVDRFVEGLGDYQRKRARAERLVHDEAIRFAPGPVTVEVNVADDVAASSLFLTVTGTSAEGGDDGEVGRGNRANGLITPGRPMTIEAVAGKNPVTHVGRLYNLAAGRIARRIVEECATVTRANCFLVSRIGRPVVDPYAFRVEIDDSSPDSRQRGAIEAIARAELTALDREWESLVAPVAAARAYGG